MSQVSRNERVVTQQVQGFPAIDGAGVHLVRVLGHGTVEAFDPILMLDSFDSRDPAAYTKGFPMHPHRGIETVSYVVHGNMQHRDNLGFEDTVSDGQVQWMTAGSGILHEELLPESEYMLGVQLWLNLPQQYKMVDPEYHNIKNEQIKEIPFDGGMLRLLAGRYQEHVGFEGKYLPLNYYDVALDEGASITLETPQDDSVMIFTLLGSARVGDTVVAPKTAAKLSAGDTLTITAEGGSARVLFMGSRALREGVAWGGPVVMNTQEELEHAFRELRNGTFIKV